MKNLARNVWMMLAILGLFVAITPTAMAASADDATEETTSFWDDVKSAGSNLYQGVKENAPGWWQSAKDAASDAVDTVKENGPGWVESAKEAGSDLLDKGKDAVQNAGDKVSGFLDDQQDQFWERTEQQIYGNSSGSSSSDEVATAAPDDSSASTESPAPGSAEGATPESTNPAESVTLESSASNAEASSSGGPRVVLDDEDPVDQGEPQTAQTPTEKSMKYAFIAVVLGLIAVGCGCYLLGKSGRR
jgi:gas vesicle protein